MTCSAETELRDEFDVALNAESSVCSRVLDLLPATI